MTAPLEDVPPSTEATPEEPLQFDNAEYAGDQSSRLRCAVCHQEIDLTYYEVNGKTVCKSCRALIESQSNKKAGLVRFTRAVLFGTGAAIAGALLYSGVTWVTGFEIGLVSIVVGAMVGGAVRAGSQHRGGLVYQILALFLCYSAIAASYLGLGILLYDGGKAEAEGSDQVVVDAPVDHGKGALKVDAKPGASEVSAQPSPDGESEIKPLAATPPEPNNAPIQVPGDGPEQGLARDDKGVGVGLLVILPLFLIFAYQLPVLANTDSPIGLFIVGFALWEAWKLNRRTPLVFNGPFSIGGDEPAPPKELPGHA